MLDAAPEAIVVVGRQGSVVALNREAERLFGWSDAESWASRPAAS